MKTILDLINDLQDGDTLRVNKANHRIEVYFSSARNGRLFSLDKAISMTILECHHDPNAYLVDEIESVMLKVQVAAMEKH